MTLSDVIIEYEAEGVLVPAEISSVYLERGLRRPSARGEMVEKGVYRTTVRGVNTELAFLLERDYRSDDIKKWGRLKSVDVVDSDQDPEPNPFKPIFRDARLRLAAA
tara:strand:- start:1272 stop:1592 length:321 start_codon:yes stop_codon:yes gene_type:complete